MLKAKLRSLEKKVNRLVPDEQETIDIELRPLGCTHPDLRPEVVKADRSGKIVTWACPNGEMNCSKCEYYKWNEAEQKVPEEVIPLEKSKTKDPR